MWTPGMLLALVLSGGVGFSLALAGGGGSIITVPMLVYVGGVPVERAIPLSLLIVGATAAVGAALQARRGHVDYRAALLLGVAGAPGAVLGARWTPLVEPSVLLVLFAILMLTVGASMLRPGDHPAEEPTGACRPATCAATGLLLGVLTGFLGVGGGFLIVPALLHFARLPIHRAAGTSLAIVGANSVFGIAGHLPALAGYEVPALALTGVTLAGMVLGLGFAGRISAAGLRRFFAVMALAVGGYVLAVNLPQIG